MTDNLLASILVVAWGDEPELGACLDAALASEGVAVEIIVVDNGDRSGQLDRVAGHRQVTVLRPGRNLGFAEGCNLAASNATGDVLVLVNPDAIVTPSTVAELVSALQDPTVGLVTASIRLADEPEKMNSAGNPVHYLGLAWAGGHGQAATDYVEPRTVASASGACCAIRADWWQSLGGFDPDYFAYHEDVELSLRSWQRGRRVVYVPTAVAYHHYEFSRNELKYYLLERNRLVTVLTTYTARTLAGLSIPLLAQELAVMAKATAEGWLPAKIRGYAWILRNWPHIRSRHRRNQAERTLNDRDLVDLYAVRFTPGIGAGGLGLAMANSVSALGGRIFRRWVA